MGDIADQIVNGDICQMCCCTEGSGEGYPFTCRECLGEMGLEDEPTLGNPAVAKNKTQCPLCHKRVRQIGLQNHVKEVHPEYQDKAYKAILKVLRGES